MHRLERFLRNAGVIALIQIGIILLLTTFGGLIDQLSFNEKVVACLLVPGVILLSWLASDFLVEHFERARRVMNIIALAGLVLVLFDPFPGGEVPFWWNSLIIVLLSSYLSCLFWMLSDERIGRI